MKEKIVVKEKREERLQELKNAVGRAWLSIKEGQMCFQIEAVFLDTSGSTAPNDGWKIKVI